MNKKHLFLIVSVYNRFLNSSKRICRDQTFYDDRTMKKRIMEISEHLSQLTEEFVMIYNYFPRMLKIHF